MTTRYVALCAFNQSSKQTHMLLLHWRIHAHPLTHTPARVQKELLTFFLSSPSLTCHTLEKKTAKQGCVCFLTCTLKLGHLSSNDFPFQKAVKQDVRCCFKTHRSSDILQMQKCTCADMPTRTLWKEWQCLSVKRSKVDRWLSVRLTSSPESPPAVCVSRAEDCWGVRLSRAGTAEWRTDAVWWHQAPGVSSLKPPSAPPTVQGETQIRTGLNSIDRYQDTYHTSTLS